METRSHWKSYFSTTMTALLFGFAGAAWAGTSHQDMDSDGNGVITADEASSNSDLMSQFSELDSNQDGALDEGEFARFEAEPESSEEAPATGESAPGMGY